MIHIYTDFYTSNMLALILTSYVAGAAPRGSCVAGRCVCKPGFAGSDCDQVVKAGGFVAGQAWQLGSGTGTSKILSCNRTIRNSRKQNLIRGLWDYRVAKIMGDIAFNLERRPSCCILCRSRQAFKFGRGSSKAPCSCIVFTWAFKGLAYHDFFGIYVYARKLPGAFG